MLEIVAPERVASRDASQMGNAGLLFVKTHPCQAGFIINPLAVLAPRLCRTNGEDPFLVVGNDLMRSCVAFPFF